MSVSPQAVPWPYRVGPYQLATDGRYTVTVIDWVTAAGWTCELSSTARIENWPM